MTGRSRMGQRSSLRRSFMRRRLHKEVGAEAAIHGDVAPHPSSQSHIGTDERLQSDRAAPGSRRRPDKGFFEDDREKDALGRRGEPGPGSARERSPSPQELNDRSGGLEARDARHDLVGRLADRHVPETVGGAPTTRTVGRSEHSCLERLCAQAPHNTPLRSGTLCGPRPTTGRPKTRLSAMERPDAATSSSSCTAGCTPRTAAGTEAHPMKQRMPPASNTSPPHAKLRLRTASCRPFKKKRTTARHTSTHARTRASRKRLRERNRRRP